MVIAVLSLPCTSNENRWLSQCCLSPALPMRTDGYRSVVFDCPHLMTGISSLLGIDTPYLLQMISIPKLPCTCEHLRRELSSRMRGSGDFPIAAGKRPSPSV